MGYQGFNTQPPEGGWRNIGIGGNAGRGFNTQPPEGGWNGASSLRITSASFNTQPPEGGWQAIGIYRQAFWVSTHSRPKAAGPWRDYPFAPLSCFNTQPPEGGWIPYVIIHPPSYMFQHTAARRRLADYVAKRMGAIMVSTHSRPKAAGV